MEHLIPTLVGLAGALAPVAVEFWRRERSVVTRASRPTGIAGAGAGSLFIDEAIVRGGRVYL